MKSSKITFPQPDKLPGRKMAVKKTLTGSKVTARADSTGTGLENDHNQIVKHHHSVKKMQTPSVRTFFISIGTSHFEFETVKRSST